MNTTTEQAVLGQDEQLMLRAARLRDFRGFECNVVPHREGKAEKGVIIGVNTDRRSNVNLIRIRLESGREVHKVEGSAELEVLGSKVELPGPGRVKGERTVLTEEERRAKIKEAKKERGRAVEVKEEKGQITGVVYDKRTETLMFRIRLESGRYINKVPGNPDLILGEMAELTVRNRSVRPTAEALEAKLRELEALKAELEAKLSVIEG